MKENEYFPKKDILGLLKFDPLSDFMGGGFIGNHPNFPFINCKCVPLSPCYWGPASDKKIQEEKLKIKQLLQMPPKIEIPVLFDKQTPEEIDMLEKLVKEVEQQAEIKHQQMIKQMMEKHLFAGMDYSAGTVDTTIYSLGEGTVQALRGYVKERITDSAQHPNTEPALVFAKHHLERGRTVIIRTNGDGVMNSISWTDKKKPTYPNT